MSRRVKILRELAGCVPIILGMLIGLLACLAITLLSGCKTRYVTQEVPVVVHDTLRQEIESRRIDTLLEREHVQIIDTLYLDTTTIATIGMPTLRHNRTTERIATTERATESAATETVRERVEVPVEVEKKLTKWEQFKMDAGGWLVGIIAFAAFLFALHFILRKKR